MRTREIGGAIALALLGLGGAAMIQVGPDLFPEYKALIFWLGVALVAAAVIGLALLLSWPEKNIRRNSPSTTFKVRGGATLDLEEIDSEADTFLDGEDFEKLSVRQSRHVPRKRGEEPQD